MVMGKWNTIMENYIKVLFYLITEIITNEIGYWKNDMWDGYGEVVFANGNKY